MQQRRGSRHRHRQGLPLLTGVAAFEPGLGLLQAMTTWFWSKKGELQQLMTVPPAVTLFGREFDLRKINSLTDTVRSTI